MRTARTTAAAAVCLLLFGCGDPDPAGRYRTTPESLREAFEATFPPAGDPKGDLARARFPQELGDLAVTLDLEAGGTFALAMTLPLLPEPSTRKGTWTQSGDTIELRATHENGSELPVPETVAATLQDGGIVLQDGPHAPRFFLEKQ